MSTGRLTDEALGMYIIRSRWLCEPLTPIESYVLCEEIVKLRAALALRTFAAILGNISMATREEALLDDG